MAPAGWIVGVVRQSPGPMRAWPLFARGWDAERVIQRPLCSGRRSSLSFRADIIGEAIELTEKAIQTCNNLKCAHARRDLGKTNHIREYDRGIFEMICNIGLTFPQRIAISGGRMFLRSASECFFSCSILSRYSFSMDLFLAQATQAPEAVASRE